MEKKKKEQEKVERGEKRKMAKTPNKVKKSKTEGLSKIIPKCKDGEYVIVVYENELFPGLVVGKDNDEILVKTMAKSGGNWKWPTRDTRDDILPYNETDIIAVINPPVSINNRGVYSVHEIEHFRNNLEK